MGNVYEIFFSQKYFRLLPEQESITDIFRGNNLISKNLKKSSLMESCFSKNRTIQNSSKFHHRCSHEGFSKLLHPEKKYLEKMYVIEFPFNKIVRHHSTAYYWILFLNCSERKRRSKILTFSKRPLFSNVIGLQFRISSLQKSRPRNIFSVSVPNYLEI